MIIYSDDALLITSKVRGMSTLYHTEKRFYTHTKCWTEQIYIFFLNCKHFLFF